MHIYGTSSPFSRSLTPRRCQSPTQIQLEELKSWFASNNFELSDAQDLALTAVDMAPKILQLCRFMRSNQK